MCIDEKVGRISCKIIRNSEIAPDVYEMIVVNKKIAEEAKPGQFLNLYCHSGGMLLPRPISICETDPKNHWVKLVYGIVGQGTKLISSYKSESTIEILGPIGKGYEIIPCKESIVVGGGLGTPPLLELVKQIQGEKKIVLGFRTNPYLINDLEKYGEVFVATEDGSVGHRGTVIDVLNLTKMMGQMIYACGPVPMLKALQHWATEKNIPAQISLEERMGCGFGACVGCVCKIKADNEVGYTYKKVCKEGPVFDAKEVLFE